MMASVCLECRTKGEQWEDYDIDLGKVVVYLRKEWS
jgi:hypothetical protein